METEEKSLMLFDNPKFKPVRVKVVDGELWFVAKDLCKNLSIQNTKDALNRLDEDEKGVVLIYTPGGTQESLAVTEAGAYALVLGSRKKEGHDFKRWITHDIVPSIRKTGSYSLDKQQQTSVQLQQLQDSFDSLATKLDKIGLLKPMVNHRYSFEKLNVFYKNATGDDSPRGIHEACGDYYGFPVPYSKDISITLRDYVLIHISNDMEIAVEELEKFVMGITSGTIVKSPMGHWVNLNGFGGNNYEWPKVLHEFNHKCAYCGRSDVPLIPEHIVPQSVMSKEHPERVDLIGSIVCSCGTCNASKGKQDMELWYRKHPKFSVKRLQKIKKHQLMYSLEEL